MAGGILPAAFPKVLKSVLRRRTALAWLAAAIVVVQPPAWADAGCGATHIDEYAAVAYIYDGDTVRLGDGRHVRLVGINTPEIGHDGAPSQPYAVKAKQALMDLISSHRHELGLHYDQERFDRYRRTLAHVYVDGQSVEAWLLNQGLATLFIVPPNDENLTCYATAEQASRDNRRGLWRLPEYQVTPVERLTTDDEGYRLIRGTVTRVAHAAHAVWLHLGDHVELRIDRQDLPYLRPLEPDMLINKEVVARGWLHARGDDRLWMRVRHRAALSPVAP
jgi:micrococcal nuclease